MNTKFNYKKYGSRARFRGQAYVAMFSLFACLLLCATGNIIAGLVVLVGCALFLNRPQPRCCAVTLSVPEILMDVLNAFKLETPELFQPGGFAQDFSSKTAVLNDKITAKIAHVPLTGTYDRANGGFKNATQDATTLIEDVPVVLDQFRIVTVNVTWLTQLQSKLPLYKEAVRNYGYALGKYVVDYALAQITALNFSNQVAVAPANITLDTFDGTIRDQCNAQKMTNKGRFAIINTAAASKLGSDDRVRSSLFYGALNGDQGYRRWGNLGGFSFIREYPDMFAGGGLWGYAGEGRGICVANRQIDFANAAAELLGVPKVMEFYPITDPESGINMTGAAWQEVGTGDVYVAAGLLFGIGAGKQGGAAGTITDNGGVRLVAA
jgi:hypothetical protein